MLPRFALFQTPAVKDQASEINVNQRRRQLDDCERHIFIYSYSEKLISLEIDCFYGM